MLLPMLTGTVATAMMFAGRQGGAYSYVVGAVFGISSLGMLATGFGTSAGQPKKAEMMAARREYLRHLEVLRRKVRDTVDPQREDLGDRRPAAGGSALPLSRRDHPVVGHGQLPAVGTPVDRRGVRAGPRRDRTP